MQYMKGGVRTLLRFGLALIALHKKKLKAGASLLSSGEAWWRKIRDYNFEPGFSFKSLEAIANGYSWGTKQNKRLGFPSDKILERYYKKNEHFAEEHIHRTAAASGTAGLMPMNSASLEESITSSSNSTSGGGEEKG